MEILAQFLAFCVVGGILVFFLIRGFYLAYGKIWTNHDPSVEPLVTKISLLWAYNSVLALTAVGITILYSIFITGILPTSNSSAKLLAAVAVLFAVLNSAVRVATYGYIKRDGELNIDQETAENRKSTFRRSYFSFINSLILLIFIGVGITIITNTGASTAIFEGVSLGDSIFYAFLVICSTLLLSVATEIILWVGPLTVPEHLAD